ncbi:hypothetical protein MXMO3_01006 [Maritalea myrionectae]|uniref:Uncharacterized protein n=1 Tax=Maritalea myrionectae TaxID=454601 RepID=A0A2R4MBY8_9HYPH|nr:hypothetical protein MXMO3_01006 [Maritalea myrionectae]
MAPQPTKIGASICGLINKYKRATGHAGGEFTRLMTSGWISAAHQLGLSNTQASNLLQASYATKARKYQRLICPRDI